MRNIQSCTFKTFKICENKVSGFVYIKFEIINLNRTHSLYGSTFTV